MVEVCMINLYLWYLIKFKYLNIKKFMIFKVCFLFESNVVNYC